MLFRSTVTGQAGPKMAAGSLLVSTDTYRLALLILWSKKATVMVTFGADATAPGATAAMLTSTGLEVRPQMLLLKAATNCSITP